MFAFTLSEAHTTYNIYSFDADGKARLAIPPRFNLTLLLMLLLLCRNIHIFIFYISSTFTVSCFRGPLINAIVLQLLHI